MNFTIRTLYWKIIIFLSIANSIEAQEIKYGSNNGNYVQILGREVYFEEYGEGDTVLMLHGGPGSITNFAKIIPKLSKDYKIFAIDSPGQGNSERAEDLSYPLMAENASLFIDKMGINKCYVVGWSDGACTGLLLAANRPDVVKKVFVSGGFANIDGFTEEVRTFWSTVTPEIIQQEWGNWHLEYQSQYPNLDWKTTIHDIRNMVNKIIYITEDQLSSIEGNVLLAYGDNDIYTMEHIIYLRKTIRDSELMILPGTNHSTFDEQPEIMSLAIKDFFDK
jgi:pimeloyl-ACP methyl ester carboxylesterase